MVPPVNQPGPGWPDQSVEVDVQGGVHDAVDLAHQVAWGGSFRSRSACAQEPPLNPSGRGEGASVLEQHPLGVRDGDRIVGADLQQQIAAAVSVLEPVDLREGGQVGETGRPVGRQSDLVEQGGPESDGHAHPRWGVREFGGGVSQRGSAGGDAVNVVGQDLHQLCQPSRVDAVAQVERAERGERLRGCGHAGLVLAVERYRR